MAKVPYKSAHPGFRPPLETAQFTREENRKLHDAPNAPTTPIMATIYQRLHIWPLISKINIAEFLDHYDLIAEISGAEFPRRADQLPPFVMCKGRPAN